MKRDKIIRMGAIVIVVALLLSLLAGALSFSPAQAAEPVKLSKSVQMLQAEDSPTGTDLDTDGDGIINNEDPDIDGDGVVNATDNDIDGDGASNFDDGDPAATNGFDGNAPQKPGAISLAEMAENGSIFWLAGGLVLVLAVIGVFLRKTLQNRGKKTQKNL